MASLAGSFLVARPVLKDPSFNRTVVLILKHESQGAFGLVVNRPSSVEGLPFPVYSGGPCTSDGVILLHGHEEWAEPTGDEPKPVIAPGIFLGDGDCLSRVSDPAPGAALRFRVFVGYAGWGPDQLEGELAAGAWAVVPASGPVLFDTPVDDLWGNLLPPSIPEPSVN
jgi:putative transcriptional regulator